MAGQKALEECAKMPTPIDVIQRISVTDSITSEKYTITSAKCSKCGRYAMAISEPAGASYLCRECYTGMSNQEIAEAFRQIGSWIDKEITTK